MAPPKYTRDFHINMEYVDHLEKKIKDTQYIVELTDKFVGDTSNDHMTEGEVCISAMKDIKALLI